MSDNREENFERGDSTPRFSRRQALVIGGAAIGGAALGGYGLSRQLGADEAAADYVLRAQETEIGLGARSATTWTYEGVLPGKELRLTQGVPVRIRVENGLSEPTTIHWHGIRLDNPMDGVPDVTQPAILPGDAFVYEFTPPDAGTFIYHTHVGTQLDRGLYGPLVVEPGTEELDYDAEAVLMLDDWLDGIDGTPDERLEALKASGMDMGGMDMDMGGMDMGGMDMGSGSSSDGMGMGGSMAQMGRHVDVSGAKPRPGSLAALANELEQGDADPGDVRYPLYLINGRPPEDPASVELGRGQRLRLRLINPAADTIFCFFVEGHELKVTHADGQAVEPVVTDAVVLGMGERYDVLIDAQGDASARMVAVPLGKPGRAEAVLRRTGSNGMNRMPGGRLDMPRRVLSYSDLVDAERTQVAGTPEELRLELGMTRGEYRWTIGGEVFADAERISVDRGSPVRLVMDNRTMMPHPMHLHGHFFQPVGGRAPGPRKDTILVAPMRQVAVDLMPDARGAWAFHCHNVYHQEAGMMRVVEVA